MNGFINTNIVKVTLIVRRSKPSPRVDRGYIHGGAKTEKSFKVTFNGSLVQSSISDLRRRFWVVLLLDYHFVLNLLKYIYVLQLNRGSPEFSRSNPVELC